MFMLWKHACLLILKQCIFTPYEILFAYILLSNAGIKTESHQKESTIYVRIHTLFYQTGPRWASTHCDMTYLTHFHNLHSKYFPLSYTSYKKCNNTLHNQTLWQQDQTKTKQNIKKKKNEHTSKRTEISLQKNVCPDVKTSVAKMYTIHCRMRLWLSSKNYRNGQLPKNIKLRNQVCHFLVPFMRYIEL